MQVGGKGSITAIERDEAGENHRATERFISVTGKGVVNSSMRNYATDPLFVKKAAEAKAEIDRVGLPKRKK